MVEIRMVELEHFLLHQYSKRHHTDKSCIDESVSGMFDILLENKFDMNSVGTGGPLFCLMIDMRSLLSIGIVIKMVNGGLDFGHTHMKGVAHKKLLRELEFKYSNTLWSVFVYICQHTNFVETIPSGSEIFGLLFGKFTISKDGVYSDYVCQPCTINMILAADNEHTIKKELLKKYNFSLRQCIKQRYPEIFNAILNN